MKCLHIVIKSDIMNVLGYPVPACETVINRCKYRIDKKGQKQDEGRKYEQDIYQRIS
jgi:hypothetical protein